MVGYTKKDLDTWSTCVARLACAAGATPDDIAQIAFGYGLFTGGAGLNGGSHKLGSLTLPMSSGNTDRQIQFMCDLGSTILCCTPSYAAYLAECICERGLQDQIKLKAGIFGAEAWSEAVSYTHLIPFFETECKPLQNKISESSQKRALLCKRTRSERKYRMKKED